MLDIKFIRENPDIVKAAIQNKRTEHVDIDELLKYADERKALSQKIDEVNRQRNEAQSNRDIEGGKRLKDELEALEATHVDIEKQYVALMLKLPNIPSPDTPIGASEDENKILRQVGEKQKINFTPKQHWDVGEALGVIDQELASRISGPRFTYLLGDLALMQMGLHALAIKILTSADTMQEIVDKSGLKVSAKPFIPVIPPLMMRSAVMNRMARLNPIDDRYFFEKDDLVFIGSAEHTLGSMLMDKTLPESAFPIRYVADTPAWRREAGAHGKDTRGLIRMHHFNKVEMETFCLPEEGYQEQDLLVAIQEHFLQLLGLHYQVVLKCTADQGDPDHRAIDMESWMPAQNKFRETHTSDYMGGYQARRLMTRVKRADGTVEFVHMNDATLVASPRMLAVLIENYQQSDGSIRVPRALQSYVGKEVIQKM